MELIYDPPPDLDLQDALRAIPDWIRESIILYNRCVMFNDMRLPEQGGMMDQKEVVMNVLAAIHTKVMELRVAEQRNATKRMNQRNTQTGRHTRRRA